MWGSSIAGGNTGKFANAGAFDPGSQIEAGHAAYVGDCQNYGPFLGTLNIRCRIVIGIQKGTIILTSAHVLQDCL